jgi:spore germination cell wall hydrolase CwlJ-like protein
VAADWSYQEALDSEKAALAFVSGNRLQSFVSEPKTLSGDVTFSRAWIDAQPEAKGDADWRCLSEALYFEARGESVKGQFAVAEVIRNRVSSGRFPNTLCGVINQGTGRKYQCQFTYTCDGASETILEPLAFERVSKVARAVIDGRSGNLTNGATHYHTTSVRPKWSRVYTKTADIGVHRFYRHNYRATSISTQSKP